MLFLGDNFSRLYALCSSLNRKRLFSMINDLPTVFEAVTQGKLVKDKPTMDSGSKSKSSTKVIVCI